MGRAEPPTIELDALRQRLGGKSGPAFWRSLEELAQTGEFKALLEREFPAAAAIWPPELSRRAFLKVMGASLALAGVGGGCVRQPDEAIIPYVKPPEHAVPGKPLFFATQLLLGGYARGALVESHLGRPTKVEGNPQHPASLGATDPFMQAAVLSLYDPDRSQATQHLAQISTWSAFVAHWTRELEAVTRARGAGLRILSGAITSPSLAGQMRLLLEALPEARWYQYEPVAQGASRQGALLAFNQPVHTVYRLGRADVVVCLDADFLLGDPGSIRYARDLISRRRARKGESPRPESESEAAPAKGPMSRLYVFEPMPTMTGATGDYRFPARPEEISAVAWLIAQRVGVPGAQGELPASLAGRREQTEIEAMLRQFSAADLRGRSLVLAGEGQPAEVHALVHAINARLGNVGETVIYTEPIEPVPEVREDPLAELAEEMAAGRVDTLVCLGTNPVYNAPADLEFADRMERVRQRIHYGLYIDETAWLSHWHVPATHELETWGDARAFDGTAGIIQPLIAPLYSNVLPLTFAAALRGEATQTGYQLLRAHWQERSGRSGRSGGDGGDFERWWRQVVHDGVIPDTAAAPIDVRAAEMPAAPRAAAPPGPGAPPGAQAAGLSVAFKPDPSIWDGQFANNAWLQELPKPITKLTWDNAVLMSPRTAERRGVKNQGVVELELDGRTMAGDAAVWIVPGHADECVTLHLGYGRPRGGQVADRAGFNAYPLRTTRAMGSAQGLGLRPTGRTYTLACTQNHFLLEGRDLVRWAPEAQFARMGAGGRSAAGALGREDRPGLEGGGRGSGEGAPRAGAAPHGDISLPQLSFYPPDDEYFAGHPAWGMVIDLTSCTGCNACVVACQAENNIPVVGKEQVNVGREMHWLRIDRYFEGRGEDTDGDDPLANPLIHHEPMLCQHCEKAPCEVVCPVNATVHGHEGLNEMVYNRCVGTRYCSNNCPYKVRRFNYLQFSPMDDPLAALKWNPDVTVRSRGVMEKCTYCVQRISAARIEAKKGGRAIRDGEVVTACQQACPTEAIVFGDLNDPASRVHWLRNQPHNYGLLTELNTQPRTTYLTRVINVPPEARPAERATGQGGGEH